MLQSNLKVNSHTPHHGFKQLTSWPENEKEKRENVKDFEFRPAPSSKPEVNIFRVQLQTVRRNYKRPRHMCM